MSSYHDRLESIAEHKFPANPCKFLLLWKRDGEDVYRDLMENAILATNDYGELYPLADVATAISEETGLACNAGDIFKHRHGKCIGCVRMQKSMT